MTREEAIDILKNTAWLAPADTGNDVDDAIELASNALRVCDKLIPYLEGMAEDMRAMGDNENASSIESALWLIEMMERGER